MALCLRGQAQGIADLNPLCALYPFAIQTDLPRPKPLLLRPETDMRREAFNEAVQTLTGLICGNL